MVWDEFGSEDTEFSKIKQESMMHSFMLKMFFFLAVLNCEEEVGKYREMGVVGKRKGRL